MKKRIILLIDDSHYWKFVEDSFKSIHAAVSAMPAGTSDEEIAASGADLLVMAFERLAPLSSPLRRMKTIVIGHGDSSIPGQSSASRERIAFLRWPFSQSRVLREAAAMLKISPRRKFRAVIRILSSDSDVGAVGRSIDFSTTGMSFTAEKYYSIGHHVTVMLSVPGDGGRLSLRGRVVRDWTNESDGSREYGVEYKSLEGPTLEALSKFVLS